MKEKLEFYKKHLEIIRGKLVHSGIGMNIDDFVNLLNTEFSLSEMIISLERPTDENVEVDVISIYSERIDFLTSMLKLVSYELEIENLPDDVKRYLNLLSLETGLTSKIERYTQILDNAKERVKAKEGEEVNE